MWTGPLDGRLRVQPLQIQFAPQRPIALLADPVADIVEARRVDGCTQKSAHRFGGAPEDRAHRHAVEIAAGRSLGRVRIEMGIDPDHAKPRMHAIEMADDGDVDGTVAAGGKHAPCARTRKNVAGAAELGKDRFPAPDAVCIFRMVAAQRHLHQRRVTRDNRSRRCRATRQVFVPTRALPLRVAETEVE